MLKTIDHANLAGAVDATLNAMEMNVAKIIVSSSINAGKKKEKKRDFFSNKIDHSRGIFQLFANCAQFKNIGMEIALGPIL